VPAEPGDVRLGITVSKKVGPAVTRNRVKRLVREAFRVRKALFGEGLDVVFIAKKSASDATYDQVASDVERIARLIRNRRSA
jgi:ribonuclease P protein component